MADRAWGQLFVQTAAPSHASVQVGTLWSDTTAGLLKRCSALGPITFVSVGSNTIDLTSQVTGILPVANDGTGVGALTPISYTPTLANVTLGTGGTITGTYIQIGKIVFWNIALILGTGGTMGTNPTFTVPVPASSVNEVTMMTYGYYFDALAGASYTARVVGADASTLLWVEFASTSAQSGNTPITSTLPFTWTVSDQIRFSGCYFAA